MGLQGKAQRGAGLGKMSVGLVRAGKEAHDRRVPTACHMPDAEILSSAQSRHRRAVDVVERPQGSSWASESTGTRYNGCGGQVPGQREASRGVR